MGNWERKNSILIMQFEGPLALKKIHVLSGEKARVLLAKLITTPIQCLFLDEPSNHLDIPSTDSLIEALKVSPGTSIFAPIMNRSLI